MEVIGIILFILIAWVVLKIFGLILHAGIFVLTLPIKILALALSGFIVFAVLLPLGIIAGLASLVLVPLALITPLMPVLLIGLGVWLFLRN